MWWCEPAFGGETAARDRRACATPAQAPRDLGERDRRPGAIVAAHDLAVDDVERVGRRSAAARPPRRAPSPRSFGRRDAGRLAGHHRDARGEGAHAVAMRSVWPWTTRMRSIVDAERIGADLRDHRLDALADRRGAGDHFDRAVGVDRDAHAVERAEPALLDEDSRGRRRPFRPPRAARADLVCSASQPTRPSALSSSPA